MSVTPSLLALSNSGFRPWVAAIVVVVVVIQVPSDALSGLLPGLIALCALLLGVQRAMPEAGQQQV